MPHSNSNKHAIKIKKLKTNTTDPNQTPPAATDPNQTPTVARGIRSILVFLLLAVVALSIWFVNSKPQPIEITVIRSFFLFVVCLLPPVIYYLFIATRKISLLNDYLLNLERLGLFPSQPTTGAATSRLNYLRKFETFYGPLPPDLTKEIIKKPNPLAALMAEKWLEWPSIEKTFNLHAVIQVFLATMLITLGWTLAFKPVVDPLKDLWSVIFSINEDPIIYAFLGAYFFSLQMLFRRYVREDLRKCAYLAISLRIILAVIGTWAVVTAMEIAGYTAPSHSFALLGFVIGVFPQSAWQIIQGVTKKLMKKFKVDLFLPGLESQLPLADLEGLTVWHESRLQEEDIENIPNMATADIVDLMISTRFPQNRIIDWVDQAILFTHLGPDKKTGPKKKGLSRDSLRLQGIYTATSLIKAFKNPRSPLHKDVETSGNIRSLIDARDRPLR